jgi:3-oxoacyl-[acyl-carrier-protein] synthase III
MIAAGIRALAVVFPDEVRSNDYWCQKYADIAAAQQKWLKKKATANGHKGQEVIPFCKTDKLLFDATMAPYFEDPFHGAIQRRVLKAGETTTSLAVRAARQAIEAANIPPTEIDLLLSTSMFPDRIGGGDAGFIAKEIAEELDYQGGAFTIDSYCGGSVAALMTACAFVQSGQARNVLVVAACNFSRGIEDLDASSRLTGDGAGAFIVGQTKAGYGLLGSKTIHTGETCGAWAITTLPDPTGSTQGGRKISLLTTENTLQAFRATGGSYLRRCTEGALLAAKVDIEDIKFFAFHTATAWYADFSAKVLGISPERTIDIYPWYGNISSAITPVTLHHAAYMGKLHPGDLVLIYMFAGQSQAAAVVMRWGEVKLGSMPQGIPSNATDFQSRRMKSELNVYV